MKDVRSHTEDLEELHKAHKGIKANVIELQKKGRSSEAAKKDLKEMDQDIAKKEATLGDFKRHSIKTWLGHKFGGLEELCEKGLIISPFGKAICAEVPTETTVPGSPRAPYTRHPRVQSLVVEAQIALHSIEFSPEVKPDFTGTSLHRSQSMYSPTRTNPVARPISAVTSNLPIDPSGDVGREARFDVGQFPLPPQLQQQPASRLRQQPYGAQQPPFSDSLDDANRIQAWRTTLHSMPENPY